jgi:1-acyl-sn-glycerol-3-phosphate acyltransferase
MSARRAHYFLFQAIARGFGHVAFGYGTQGTENVPREGPFLLAANHKSYFDPPFVGGGVPREMHYFAKRQLFEVPLLSGLIRACGAIPVDRDAADRRAVSAALSILKRGDGLLVFPEGTRIRRAGFAAPKPGIGLLAVRSGAPVVPACIAWSWAPQRRWWKRIPVRVRYGPPLRFAPAPPETPAREAYAAAALAIMEAIRSLAPPGFATDAATAETNPAKKAH